MTSKLFRLVALLALLWVPVALADDSLGKTAPQETGGSPLAVARSVVYFPFKGVICVVGTVASFPTYLLSGLDSQVKNDSETLRAKYCSQDHLFSSEWPR